MENFITTANAVLPLFLIMALGYVIRRTPLMDQHTHQMMNKLIFKLFLPILLFKNISTSKLDALSGSWVFLFAFIAEMTVFLTLFAVVPLIEKENSRRGVLIQAMGRSNYALFGLPLVGLLYPGEDIAVASMLVAISIPTFNVMSVIALETYRGGKVNPLKILRGIVTNPLIISCALGFLWLISGLTMPTFIQTAINDTAKIATPLSLFVLGGAFEFSRIRCNARPLIIGTLGKLVIVPLLGLTVAVLCGYRGMELASLGVAFMAPCAVSSYPMAQQMGGDGELAGQLVVFTTAFSMFSVFGFMYALKCMALI
ncbi:MAG: AEC family transporter [Candidatus Fimadaptatus sp.]